MNETTINVILISAIYIIGYLFAFFLAIVDSYLEARSEDDNVTIYTRMLYRYFIICLLSWIMVGFLLFIHLPIRLIKYGLLGKVPPGE